MKRKHLFSIIIAIILAVVMFGISACKVEGPTVVPVTSVVITQSTASVKVGETVTLTAEVSPSDATNKAVTWKSDDTSVATVDSYGTVTGVKEGTAKITAKAGGVTSAECTVTVTQKTEGGTTVAVTSVTITPSTASVNEGGTVVLTATVLPTDATDQTIEWKSSDDSVATVNSDGAVTGVSAGIANITAKAGGVTSAACVVTVTPNSGGPTVVPVTSVVITQSTASVNVGGTVTLTATVNPSNATNATVSWESSDNSIATVNSSGAVTGVAVGTAYITAKAGGVSSTACAVTVTANTTPGGTTVAVTSVTISPTSASVKEGGTVVLTATVLPTDATDKTVEWKSDNESVATVSAGVVTAIAAGTAHITAKAGGVTSATACTVTVTADTPGGGTGGGDTTTSNIPYEYYGNETAAFEWTDSNPASAKVEYKLHSETQYKEITGADKQLIRAKTATLARVDIVGLKGGEYYDFKITPSSGSVLTATNKKIAAHDRSGYAFHTKSGGRLDVGAYNADGTLKSNAKIIYLTEDNKNDIDGNETSIAEYLKSFQNKASNSTPVVIRVIGTVGSATWNKKTYSGYSKSNPLSAYDFVNLTPGNNNSKLVVQDGKEYTQQQLIDGGYNTLNYYPEKYNGAKCDPIDGLNSKIKCSTDDKLGFVYDSCWNDCTIYNMENVTIEGIGEDAEIFQWGFTFKQCNSIEVRNLHFDDYTEDACSFEGDSTSNAAENLNGFKGYQNIWLHHNTFDEGMNYWDVCDEQDKGDGDGSTDFKGVKNVTIAYNTYIETHKTNLIGGGDSHTTANVTFHHNYYDSCNQRMPLGRQANMHMYNNYYSSSTLYSISLRAGAYAFIENCVFTEDTDKHYPLELLEGKNKAGKVLKASAKVINCDITKSKLSDYNKCGEDYLYVGESEDRGHVMSVCDNMFAKHFDTDADKFYYKNGVSDVMIMHDLSEIKTTIPKVAGVQKHDGMVLDPDTFTPGSGSTGDDNTPTNPPATGGQTITVIDDFTSLDGKASYDITLSGGAAGYLVNNKIAAEKPGSTMALSGTGLKLQSATTLSFKTVATLSKTVKIVVKLDTAKAKYFNLTTGSGSAQKVDADSSGNVTITLQANTDYKIGRADAEGTILAISLIIG